MLEIQKERCLITEAGEQETTLKHSKRHYMNKVIKGQGYFMLVSSLSLEGINGESGYPFVGMKRHVWFCCLLCGDKGWVGVVPLNFRQSWFLFQLSGGGGGEWRGMGGDTWD